MPERTPKPGRREPVVGELGRSGRRSRDGLPQVSVQPKASARDAGGAPSSVRRARRRAWWWALFVIVLAVALGLVWINQDRLRSLLPSTHLTTLLDEASEALQAGRLNGTHGDSARELYAEVLRQEPDNNEAMDGLRQVGKAELVRATVAIGKGDFDAARRYLGDARQILGGGADVMAVTKALHRAERSEKYLSGTIAKAEAALAAGHVAGADGAAALYHVVLEVAPDNAVARHGLARAGKMIAADASEALQAGDLAQASSLIDTLSRLLPKFSGLPGLRVRFADTRKRVLSELVAKGDKAVRAGRFAGPGSDTALHYYRAAVKIDAKNAAARAGLAKVARAIVLQASAAMDGGDTTQAGHLLDKARSIAPRVPEIAAAARRLESMKTAAPAATAPRVLSKSDREQVAALLDKAAAAVKAGHVMLPPGASAYDLYRQVLAVDGSNAKALEGLRMLAGKMHEFFRDAMNRGRLDEAAQYLATMRSLAGSDARIKAMADALAAAWLRRAETDIAAGRPVAAHDAIDVARRFDPGNPDIGRLSAKLENAVRP